MKRLFLTIGSVLSAALSFAQVCNIDGQTFTPSSLPLFTYHFPSDTTDELITNTYISVTNDSVYYADVMTYKKECLSMYIVKAGFKDLKPDVGYEMKEAVLDEKKKLMGYVLTVYTSIGRNVFLTKQASKKYGWSEVKGNLLNIICKDQPSAEYIKTEIEKKVKSK